MITAPLKPRMTPNSPGRTSISRFRCFSMRSVVNSFPLMWGFAPERRIATYTGVYFTFNQSAYSRRSQAWETIATLPCSRS